MGGPRRSAFFILQGESLGGSREPLATPLGNSGPPSPWRNGRLSCQLWGPRQPAAGSPEEAACQAGAAGTPGEGLAAPGHPHTLAGTPRCSKSLTPPSQRNLQAPSGSTLAAAP